MGSEGQRGINQMGETVRDLQNLDSSDVGIVDTAENIHLHLYLNKSCSLISTLDILFLLKQGKYRSTGSDYATCFQCYSTLFQNF